MAVAAAMRIGTEDIKGVWRVEWDGEDWSYTLLEKPKDVSDLLWRADKMLARTDFEITQLEVIKELFAEQAPYPMDHRQWMAKSIMDAHVKKKLGMIVLPMSDDYLFILR